ncbi:HAAS signaling domain-containing protein [Gracilibacillus saliphilus]|uniref:HAAS signaling domain-containing protein n=1 Tax=Gracilibacillus saliphilus TaxID=543890 RepID=UPI0013CF743D|nr:DUF1700 domain-containing protein [Gracilibacillus saliphilus]
MKKDEFLKLLKSNLKYISKKEKENIVAEYSRYFAVEVDEDKSEEEICKKLGKPKEIAKELNAVNTIHEIENNLSIKSISKALFSVMALSVMNFIIIIASLFILLLFTPVILAYLIGVPIMIVSPIILIVMGFINGFNTLGMSEIYEVLRGITIGSLLAIIGFYFGKFIIKLLINFLEWNISRYKETINLKTRKIGCTH